MKMNQEIKTRSVKKQGIRKLMKTIILTVLLTLISLDITHGVIEMVYFKTLMTNVDFRAADGHQYLIDEQMKEKYPKLTFFREWFKSPTLGLADQIIRFGKKN